MLFVGLEERDDISAHAKLVMSAMGTRHALVCIGSELDDSGESNGGDGENTQ